MKRSFHELLAWLDSLSDPFQELREGVRMAVDIAPLDPEMALTRARKVLEFMVRDVYERRLHEPPGTRPLENLLQRLGKDGHFPHRLEAYANMVRTLGNVGTHSFGEKITTADVDNALNDLTPILQWYLEVERPEGRLSGDGSVGSRSSTTLKPSATSAIRSANVVPKGLRSFEAGDAGFFLALLPGARDETGLPESLRFWKYRIETVSEPAFTVGVIYGPSGCGKSSLLKAGLLPRLAERILPIYIEAAASDTEARLLRGLRRRCPALPNELDLTSTMTALRQGQTLAKDQKVLIVVDQFEQWLHTRRAEENTELTQAFRQCDGEHLQCLVTVRDDFWLALSRFMKELHLELLQGQNCALVDLFDRDHARKVLAAFGRAFDRLEATPPKELEAFLDHAVEGLAQDGRIVPVRLALFAEMVKGKPWIPITLKEVGGMRGVGFHFLEETISSASADPRYRLHQTAVRAVLKALLPETGTDIKGNMQSYAKLLQVSGYARRPSDFVELLRILDKELRLLTPTEPAAFEGEEKELVCSGGQYYQLTHDYLVHSLRDWLTFKQRRTWRGRTELRLEERVAAWSARPESRYLPSWWEGLNIRLFTRKQSWSPEQRKMMRKARQYHAIQGGVAALLLLVGILFAWRIRANIIETHVADLVHTVLNAEIDQLPTLIPKLRSYRAWTDPLLRKAWKEAEKNHDTRKQLHASLALLPVDPGQVDYLYERLLTAEPEEIEIIRDALFSYKDQLITRLWTALASSAKQHDNQRLRASYALAKYEPDNPQWQQYIGAVAEKLVTANPIHLGIWADGFRPVSKGLLAPLSAIFRERHKDRITERNMAANILADYAADQLDVLLDLLLDADEKQFGQLFPKVEGRRKEALTLLSEIVAVDNLDLQRLKTEEEKEQRGQRQANAAVALLRLGESDKVWPVLQHRTDPRAQSYLIHRISLLGTDPEAFIQRLEKAEVSERRAILLSLGGYETDNLPINKRETLIGKVLNLYQNDCDPGVHGAAEWVLRRWNREEAMKPVDKELMTGKREGDRGWYINREGQTMVVIDGPNDFIMGSPATELGRKGGRQGGDEKCHKRIVPRTFAIAGKEVTIEQFARFHRDHLYDEQFAKDKQSSVNRVTWFEAAAYCNWLSKQEGILESDWCYEPNDKNEIGPGMKLASGYLKRGGYRLPTEAEWELACRGKTITSRYYGESEDLLSLYAWYTKNSQDRGLMLGSQLMRPNQFGLFNMLGNALEWCGEVVAPYDAADGKKVIDEVGKAREIVESISCVLRGGSFYSPSVNIRSAYRDGDRPSLRNVAVGFRVARTLRKSSD